MNKSSEGNMALLTPEHISLALHGAGEERSRARKLPTLADARERACFAVAKEILADEGLGDDSYAEKTMGLESLLALVATVGSLSMTCLSAATFQIDPPTNDPTPLAG